jgi:hypothetical protein
LYPSVAKKIKICFGTATTPFKTQESELPLYPWVAEQILIRFNEDNNFATPRYGMAHAMARSPNVEEPLYPWMAELIKIGIQRDHKKKTCSAKNDGLPLYDSIVKIMRIQFLGIQFVESSF